jgi:DNA primase
LITPELPLYWKYLKDRCVPEDFPAMTAIRNDGVHWTRPFVLIPFSFDNAMVGYTTRFLDNKTPKYISNSQPGYVFGIDQQVSDWQYVLVVEGIFDALSIGGVAVMHNTVSDAQARLIRNLGREIVVIPDQDKAGIELIDRALELGWSVSIPEWPDCKDVNDAVVKFGKLATLISIVQSKESSRIKIELKRKWLEKKIQT